MKRMVRELALEDFVSEPDGIYTLVRGRDIVGHFMDLNIKVAKRHLADLNLGPDYDIWSFKQRMSSYPEDAYYDKVYPSLKRLVDTI